MAYIDSDGRITIDEGAALADVAKEAAAIEVLQNAKTNLQALLTECAAYQGATIAAISAKAEEKIRSIDTLISNLEATQTYTKNVVEHYKLLDEQCRAMIAQEG